MQKSLVCSYDKRSRVPRRGASRGMTMVELLVAALILSVSLGAMIAAWLTMMTSTITIDDQAGAYAVARTALERARVVGFYSTPMSPPTTLASSDGTIVTALPLESQWSSPQIGGNNASTSDYAHRYYNQMGVEIGCDMSGCSPSGSDTNVPAGTRYRVEMYTTATQNTTTGTLTTSQTRPLNRTDLNMMTIYVSVFLVYPDGTYNESSPLYSTATTTILGGVS
jgi:prepilin-type N-terminal cleavage/methylation domain-containing protein